MFSPLIRRFLALLVAGAAVAAPRTVRDADVCTSPRIRRAWCVYPWDSPHTFGVAAQFSDCSPSAMLLLGIHSMTRKRRHT